MPCLCFGSLSSCAGAVSGKVLKIDGEMAKYMMEAQILYYIAVMEKKSP